MRGGADKNAIGYERTVYFPSLRQTVHLVKTPFVGFGVLEDGTSVRLTELAKRERAAHRVRVGAFLPGYHQHLSSLSPKELSAAVVYFTPRVADWSDLTRRLNAFDPAVVAAARHELTLATESHGHELAADLELAGLEVTKVGSTMSAIFVRGTAHQLLSVGHPGDPAIDMIMESTSLRPELRHHVQAGCFGGDDKSVHADCVDPNVFHHVDQTFNADGLFGRHQKIGVYEDVGDNTLDRFHESFQFSAGPVYSGTYSSNAVDHGTAVASVILGAYRGRRCGASEATLYYPNDGVPQSFPDLNNPPNGTVTLPAVICHPDATADAYRWMESHGTPGDFDNPPLAVVNESFGCIHENIACSYADARTEEGVTQDYYARYRGMMIVKAAGNQNCADERHEACPFSLNSLCVGGVDSGGNMYASSSTTNPGAHDPAYFEDREEPDLVAYGGQDAPFSQGACAADLTTGNQGWRPWRGTSFAAPIVSSMVALLRERCERGLGGHFRPQDLRAGFRNAAWFGNPTDTAYSTPRPGWDFSDGAGLLLADDFTSCPVPQANPVSLRDGDSMPKGRSPYVDNGWFPPGETQRFTQPMGFNEAPADSDRVGTRVFRGELVEGRRVRATISWNSCAANPQGTAPGRVAVDYDLFLYWRDTETYVWASQSYDDNNEGFDYTVPIGEGGDYEIFVSWPARATSCEGGNYEPYGFSLRFL